MAKKLRALDRIDPRKVPLPNGTKVTARVELWAGERRVPSGAVGQVVTSDGQHVDVRLGDGAVVRYLRTDVVPIKWGQLRYAVDREQAWQNLRPCVVLETVVGSRAWGLADAESDTDVRGVFVSPFSWTIGLVEPPSELISRDGSETFWEIEKTIRQALRADPNTLETLFVPGAEATDVLGAWLLEERDAFVSQEIYGSFGRYAISQLNKLRQSLRLAEHRMHVLSWLRADPTLTLDEVAARLSAEVTIDAPSERDRLQRAKAYVKQLYASLYDQGLIGARDLGALAAFAASHEHSFQTPRQLRPKNAYNLVRLISTATTWLASGQPQLEVTGALREELLAIKRGEVALDEVVAIAEGMMPALDRARATTTLAKRPNVAAADRLLRRIRSEAARRFFAGDAGPLGAGAPAMPHATEDT